MKLVHCLHLELPNLYSARKKGYFKGMSISVKERGLSDEETKVRWEPSKFPDN